MPDVRTAWVILALTEAAAAVTVVALIASGYSWNFLIANYAVTNLWMGATFAPFGALVAARSPRLVIGWLFSGFGLAFTISAAFLGVGLWGSAIAPTEHWGATLGWIGDFLWTPAFATFLPLIVLLFPDGRLPSRRWRPVAILAVTNGVLWQVGWALDPASLHATPFATLAPMAPALLASVGHGLVSAGNMVVGLTGILVLTAFVSRLRRSAGVERAQMSWLAWGVGIAVVLFVPRFSAGTAGIILLLGVPVLPASAAIAVLRHQLFDVDLVIDRTLVYAALTVVVAAVYGAAISIGGLVGSGKARSPSFIGALAAALLFAPARVWIQRAVNHILYGQRDEPSAVVSKVAARLGAAGSAQQLLLSLAVTTATALRVPYVAVELAWPDRTQIIAHGNPSDDMTRVDMVHQGRTVGALVIGRRPGERAIPPRERVLLNDLASQAAVAAANVLLTDALQRSRERIVTAREEERRRLRNDLHDGLGPQLTGVALGLDLLAEGAQADPQAATVTAERLRGEVEDAIQDVRRLVHGLRPPRLDEVGLCGALREAAFRAERSGLIVEVNLPDECIDLPAATEVAVYRIATEAIINVVRHANARSCIVRLRIESRIHLSVTDDGRGFDATEDGIGTTSMRERAEELGGTLTISPTDGGGCRIEAHLPVPPP